MTARWAIWALAHDRVAGSDFLACSVIDSIRFRQRRKHHLSDPTLVTRFERPR